MHPSVVSNSFSGTLYTDGSLLSKLGGEVTSRMGSRDWQSRRSTLTPVSLLSAWCHAHQVTYAPTHSEGRVLGTKPSVVVAPVWSEVHHRLPDWNMGAGHGQEMVWHRTWWLSEDMGDGSRDGAVTKRKAHRSRGVTAAEDTAPAHRQRVRMPNLISFKKYGSRREEDGERSAES